MFDKTSQRGRNGTLLVSGFAVMGMLVTGCGSGGDAAIDGGEDAAELVVGDPKAPEQDSVVMASYRQGSIAPVFAPEANAAAEENGFGVEATWIENSAAGLALVLGGDAQFSYSSYWGVVDAINQGVDLVVVADQFIDPEGKLTLEALPDSGIESLEDLVGKTVSVPGLNTLQHNRLQYLMLEAGLDPESVEFVEFPFGEVASALANGAIDAGSVAGPAQITLQEEQATVSVVDFNAGRFADATEGGIVATREFVEANPNTVAAFQCAWTSGAEEVNGDEELYIDIIVDELGFPEDVAAKDAEKMPIFPTEPDIAKIQDYPDVMVEIGSLEETVDMAPYVMDPPADC